MLAAATAWQSAHADERPTARLALDSRLAATAVSLAEQAAEDSVGNDLSRFVAGAILGVGIDTGTVSIMVDGGFYTGGLSPAKISEHYSGADGSGTAIGFSVGAAARYHRRYRERLSFIGDLRLGYFRMNLRGDSPAHLSSLYMEIGGGVARPIRISGLESRLALIASLRALRLSSFSAQGLTEGSLNVDSPSLALYPGLSLSYDIVF